MPAEGKQAALHRKAYRKGKQADGHRLRPPVLEGKALMQERVETLGGGIFIHISREHRFGTDAFLLASFSQAKKGEKACDLCSGCGIVGLLWQREEENRPESTYCVELQKEAVALLERSVQQSGLSERVFPIEKDLRALTGRDIPIGSFDLCACNPPYKAAGRGLLSERAEKAAARHELFCPLNDLCRMAARLLRTGGRFCLCQRPERLCDIFAAMRESGLEPKRLRMVQKRPDTAPWLVLIEGRRGGNPFLTVEPPLIIQDESGAFSAELRRIYRLFEESAEAAPSL